MDLVKADAPVQKGRYRHFVGGIKHRCSAHWRLQCFPSQPQTGKALGVAMAAAGVVAAVLILSVADFSWMWLQHAALLELLSPIRLWRLSGSVRIP